MKTFLIASVLAAVGATSALAADDGASNRLNVPRDQWVSPSQIAEKLAAQGYKVHKIETDDGAYEVDMTDKNGVLIEAHVHPATGELLPGYDD